MTEPVYDETGKCVCEDCIAIRALIAALADTADIPIMLVVVDDDYCNCDACGCQCEVCARTPRDTICRDAKE